MQKCSILSKFQNCTNWSLPGHFSKVVKFVQFDAAISGGFSAYWSSHAIIKTVQIIFARTPNQASKAAQRPALEADQQAKGSEHTPKPNDQNFRPCYTKGTPHWCSSHQLHAKHWRQKPPKQRSASLPYCK